MKKGVREPEVTRLLGQSHLVAGGLSQEAKQLLRCLLMFGEDSQWIVNMGTAGETELEDV